MTDQEKRRSILFFHRRGEEYYRWACRLLDTVTSVEYVFYAAALDEFLEITRNSATTWHLIVVDEERAESYGSVLENVERENPKLVIAVERASAEQVATANLPLNWISFPSPKDQVAWVSTIRSLLSGTDEGH